MWKDPDSQWNHVINDESIFTMGAIQVPRHKMCELMS